MPKRDFWDGVYVQKPETLEITASLTVRSHLSGHNLGLMVIL